MSRTALALFTALLLAGCAGAPPLPAGADREQAWEQHSEQLRGVEHWNLSGRLALRADGKAWHASLAWRQDQSRYAVRITAPLGQGSMRLDGNPEFVRLQTSDGARAVDRDPDGLLYRQLGWPVPVASLRYWVLGLPAPGPAERRLDVQGRLERLSQSGWDIRFMDYRLEGNVELPGRVFASRDEAEVRLVIGNWELGPMLGGV